MNAVSDYSPLFFFAIVFNYFTFILLFWKDIETLATRTVSLVATDVKTRNFVGVRRETIGPEKKRLTSQQGFKRSKRPVDKSFWTKKKQLKSHTEASLQQNLYGFKLNKCAPKIHGIPKITVFRVTIDITDIHLRTYFSQFEFVSIKQVRHRHWRFRTYDNDLQGLCIPVTLLFRGRQIYVILKRRRPHCLTCGTTHHLSNVQKGIWCHRPKHHHLGKQWGQIKTRKPSNAMSVRRWWRRRRKLRSQLTL